MNKFVCKSGFVVLLFILSLFAAGPIVRIGDDDYTSSDLLAKLKDSDQDPMDAVDQIKRGKALQLLAESKNIKDDDAEGALYKSLFGTSIDDDEIIANDEVLPAAVKNDANLRRMLFDRRIAQTADEEIPVTFLDENGFWDLVKKCKSYQIRKQQGFETPMTNWQYTWSELVVDPDQEVAVKKGKSFLKGSELNIWMKQNYSRTIRVYAKRKHGKDEILDVLARKAVQAKLVAQKVNEKKLSVKDNFIERSVDDYINDNMMASDFSAGNIKGKSYHDARELIKEEYRMKSGTRLNKIRKLCKGEEALKNIDCKEAVYCINAAVGSMQTDLLNSVEENEIYDWIKANGFKGSFNDARGVLAQEMYDKAVDDDLLQEQITITSFKK